MDFGEIFTNEQYDVLEKAYGSLYLTKALKGIAPFTLKKSEKDGLETSLLRLFTFEKRRTVGTGMFGNTNKVFMKNAERISEYYEKRFGHAPELTEYRPTLESVVSDVINIVSLDFSPETVSIALSVVATV